MDFEDWLNVCFSLGVRFYFGCAFILCVLLFWVAMQ